MITKNAVILIGQIEAERAAGKERVGTPPRGGSTRFRPIMLTAAVDRVRHDPDRAHRVLGADGVRDHGRAARGTLLTLVFLPALYVAWFGRGEALEPAEAAAPLQAATS